MRRQGIALQATESIINSVSNFTSPTTTTPGYPLYGTNVDPPPATTKIILQIERGGFEVFSGDTTLAQLKRKPQELVSFLYRDNTFPAGALLMTGTGIVPSDDFTLKSGDVVKITIEGIGTLQNPMD